MVQKSLRVGTVDTVVPLVIRATGALHVKTTGALVVVDVAIIVTLIFYIFLKKYRVT